jgi:protein-S-isoprenylcysteine O-methyltransferase Ste14
MRMETRVPPPLVALLFGALMWGADRALPVARLGFTGQEPLAWLLLGAGIGVTLSGMLAFRAARTTVDPIHPERASQLVVNGIYRFTRNPMYLGLLLDLGAWAVYLGQPAVLLALPLWVLYIDRFQIRPEEAAMHRLFGAAYSAYCLRVRRWI